jgi:hypothetical protein
VVSGAIARLESWEMGPGESQKLPQILRKAQFFPKMIVFEIFLTGYGKCALSG